MFGKNNRKNSAQVKSPQYLETKQEISRNGFNSPLDNVNGSSASHMSFELGPLGSSRSAVGNRNSPTMQRRSVLSSGLLRSLEQNVVDYALLSLQRAGPIVKKEKYKVQNVEILRR